MAQLAGPRAITGIRVKADLPASASAYDVLRELALQINWDGEAAPAVWSPLGSGVSDFATSVVATNQAIYVGGAFSSAGGKESNFLARWGYYQTYLPLVIK